MPYLERGEAAIWWEAAGAGSAVLLIMGLGYPCDMWYRTIPALSESHRVISFDNRGAGRTGAPPGPYSIEMMAEDAASVLEAAGETCAHIVGISLGGIIAQELVLERPEICSSLALLCTHPGGTNAVPPSAAALQMLQARSTMTPAEAAEVAVPFVYAPTTDRRLIDEDIAVRMARPTDPAGYANQLGAALSYAGSYDRLPTVSVPTLILHGALDGLVPPTNAEVLARRIPTAEMHLIQGASHILTTDVEEEVNERLVGFLGQVDAATDQR